MNFNLTILETVTEAAKAKAAGQAAWVRAIEKAAEQLLDNPYICEHDGGLLILSYSNETYHANGACQCRAYANGRPCWHRAAAQLVRRYREAEAAQVAAPPPAETVVADERPALIANIKAAWHRARPFESIEGAVRQVFGAAAKLEELATDDLRRVLSAFTSPARRAPAPTVRPVITHNQALDACAKQRRTVGPDGWWIKHRNGRAWDGWEV